MLLALTVLDKVVFTVDLISYVNHQMCSAVVNQSRN